MPIVENWSEPLERAIEAKLSSSVNRNYETLRQAQQLAALLDGAKQSGDLARRLEEYARDLESEYQANVEAIRQSASAQRAEECVRRMEAFRGYKDAEAVIAEGRERAERLSREEAARAEALKKRNMLIYLSIAAVAVAALAFVIVHGMQVNRRIEGRIAEVRAMVDEGRREDAIDALAALAGDKITGQEHPTLYAVTESMLESAAAEEGYDAAFGLCDRLLESAPDAVDRDGFQSFVSAQVADTSLEPARRWMLLDQLTRRDMSVSGLDRDAMTALVLDYAATLSPLEAWPVVRDARAGNLGRITDD